MAYSQGLSFSVQAVASLINLDDTAAQHAGTLTYCPCPVTIEAFGFVVTEVFVTDVGTFALNLSKSARAEWDDASPDSPAILAVLTPSLLSGAAIGNIVYSSSAKLPIRIAAGEIFYTDHVDGGTTVAGSVRPFVIYRVDGFVDSKLDTKAFPFAT